MKSSLPLGAHWDGSGVNFAMYSGSAQRVELCLFGAANQADSRRIPLSATGEGAWHTYVADARPGQLYGYRVDGPYAPHEGLRFNAAKLLLDPYARAMTGPIPSDDVLLGYDVHRPEFPDGRDSALAMPKCMVVDDRWDWGDDRNPRTRWADTVLYECHVKGLTRLHPDIEPELRGTYLGLGSPPIIEHLLKLGVTAVELLPIQYFVNERRLLPMGLVNYWGYNTIGFFAPDVRYATAPHLAIAEFRMMVQSLHKAGIEVILDVVYNHTAEGDEQGPTLSLRGIDNHAYYRLDGGTPWRYMNHTACGNTLNTSHPRTRQLVLDSLRYWVNEMHVDGFRFDLAPALCRDTAGVDSSFRFFQDILQDPALGRVKLLVEPWDAEPDGFRLGSFPSGIVEWNASYRDCIRKFWRGDDGQLAEFASRLAGSSDIFSGRMTPQAGVNFVTCHDGSTLHDLVSYERKYNQANGEENRDGTRDSFGQNHGVEGPTDNAKINETRERTKRNLLATLVFSQGVPMLLAGDEMGRTQRGNDNAYCQDNEISWVDWKLDATKRELLDFSRRVLAIRKQYAAFRRDTFFTDRDVRWLDENGRELSPVEWHDSKRRCLSMLIPGTNREGQENKSGYKSLLLLINAHLDAHNFHLPAGMTWRELLGTDHACSSSIHEGEVELQGGSLMLLES